MKIFRKRKILSFAVFCLFISVEFKLLLIRFFLSQFNYLLGNYQFDKLDEIDLGYVYKKRRFISRKGRKEKTLRKGFSDRLHIESLFHPFGVCLNF